MQANFERPHVLAVDDDLGDLDMLCQSLLKEGFTVDAATSAEEALSSLNRTVPEILILDAGLPGINGLPFLVQFRQNPGTKLVPVILLGDPEDKGSTQRGLDQGANDYVTRPISMPTLVARLWMLHRRVQTCGKDTTRSKTAMRTAVFDEVTGAHSRRSLYRTLEMETDGTGKCGRNWSAVMIDLDWFGRIGTEHGTATGNNVLRQVVQRVSVQLQPSDILCRYDDDAFCVLLTDCLPQDAVEIAERIRRAVERRPFAVGDRAVLITASLGVASFVPGSPFGSMQVLEEAELALNDAKRYGRNRVWMASCMESMVH